MPSAAFSDAWDDVKSRRANKRQAFIIASVILENGKYGRLHVEVQSSFMSFLHERHDARCLSQESGVDCVRIEGQESKVMIQRSVFETGGARSINKLHRLNG
jgi:hypothetical protein